MSTYSSYKPGRVGVSSLTAGTDTAVTTATGAVTVYSTATLDSIVSRGSTTTYAVSIANTTTSYDSSTGALTVIGGVGIQGALNVGGQIYSSGTLVITTATINQYANQTVINAGTDISVNTTTGNITISDTATLQSVTSRGNATDRAISITNSGTSTSTTTGALTISGGLGVGGDLYLGNNATIPNVLYLGSINSRLIVNNDPLDSNSTATIFINSRTTVGDSKLVLENTALNGQSFGIEVGGYNRSVTAGQSINEGNLTIFDNNAGVYRLILAKNTGNLIVGGNTSTGLLSSIDDGNLLQVKGTISYQDTLLETRVISVNTTATTLIDSYSADTYRSCKSIVQIEDPGVNYQLTEIVLIMDSLGNLYKSEYGIIATSGIESGTFSAEYSATIINLYFTPSVSSNKTVTVTKTALPRADLSGV